VLTPLDILRRVVAPSDCVIFDVGANDGGSSELYRLIFERPVIHAFEPQPTVFAALEQKLGRTPGVILNRVALGERPGRAPLYRNSDHRTSSLLPLDPDAWWTRQLGLTTEERLEVPVDTIDNYCTARAIDRIDLLKIDTQGYEPDCLRGARDMLSRQAIGVIQVEILNHKKYARRTRFLDIETILAPHGYRLFNITDLVGNDQGELLVLDAIYVLERDHP
jgi:FkbM family methyltransferase